MEVRSKQRKPLRKSAGFEGEDVEEVDLKQQVQLLKERGNALAEAGDFAGALAKFSSASLLDAVDFTLHELKAQVLLQMARPFEAISAATQCVELQPRWAEGWLTLARAQADFGEIDLAMASVHKARDLAPGNAEIVEEVERIRQLREELHIHRSTMRAVGHLTEDGTSPPASADHHDDDSNNDPAAQEVARCLYNLSSRARAVDNDAAIAGGSTEVDMHLQG